VGLNQHYFIRTQLLYPVYELLGGSELSRLEIVADQDDVDLMLDKELSDRDQTMPRLVLLDYTIGQADHPSLVGLSQL